MPNRYERERAKFLTLEVLYSLSFHPPLLKQRSRVTRRRTATYLRACETGLRSKRREMSGVMVRLTRTNYTGGPNRLSSSIFSSVFPRLFHLLSRSLPAVLSFQFEVQWRCTILSHKLASPILSHKFVNAKPSRLRANRFLSIT